MTATDDEIERAAAALAAGRLVAFPTETVYGLGADASDPTAVAQIFSVKGRPTDHPVIVHLPDGGGLAAWAADVPPAAQRLADALWPGPLTLVLARSARVPDAVTGGRSTVGLRVPNHPVARQLLRAFAIRRTDGGIAAPSANRFGHVSPTTAEHVRSDLGDDVEIVLDGGPCAIGVESTIVDFTRAAPEVLRLGGVGLDRLTELLGTPPAVVTGEVDASGATDAMSVRAPGMLAAHYAPRARVEVIATPSAVGPRAAELDADGRTVVVVAPHVLDGLPAAAIELEPAGPADDYARVLYARLRQADRLGADVVLAVPPPPGGLGDAVRDRLERAASA